MKKSLLFLSLFFAACSELATELPEAQQDVSPRTLAAGAEAGDYYWSGGQKIWLETDLTQMIVGFDDQQALTAFAATTPKATPFTGRAMALVDVRDAVTKQKLTADKAVKNSIFAHKFRGNDTPFYLTGDMIMQPKAGVSANEILTRFDVRGQIVEVTSTGIVIVRLEDWSTILATANSIYESGSVEWCHPDFITPIERTTNDPRFSQQYYLKNTGQGGGTVGVDIKAEQAWTLSTGTGIRVAVIDDGVEQHEDLPGRVLQGYTPLNPTGYGGPTTQVVPGVTMGHGQACAGIIAASHNTLGIAGVAPNVQIVPINIFHTWAYNSSLGRYISIESVQNVAAAIEYAWNPNKGDADVISNSWGYESVPAQADYITQEITNAVTQGRGYKGCVVVFASGNSPNYMNIGAPRPVSFPASLSNVISVGALSKYGTLWAYSCFGPELDVVAPTGWVNQQGDVVTTDRMGSNGYMSGNYVTTFGGTSAACPQVAGIAALLLSVDSDLTYTEVADIIQRTAYKLPAYFAPGTIPAARNDQVGYGLVNAYAAVNYVVNPPAPTYRDVWLTVFNQASYSTVFTIQVGNDPAFNTTIAAGGEYSKLYTAQTGSSLTFSVYAMGVGSSHTQIMNHFGMVDFYWSGSYWDIQAMRAPADSLAQI